MTDERPNGVSISVHEYVTMRFEEHNRQHQAEAMAVKLAADNAAQRLLLLISIIVAVTAIVGVYIQLH